MNKFVVPSYKSDNFHCPICGVYAHQNWRDLYVGSGYADDNLPFQWRTNLSYRPYPLTVSYCEHCKCFSLWAGDRLIIPSASTLPHPHVETPTKVSKTYSEAMNVYPSSVRAADALIRIALQELVTELGDQGNNITEDIARFVEDGLPAQIQQALEYLGVIGECPVEPEVIHTEDKKEETIALFEIFNLIVEYMIIKKKQMKTLYDKLPKQEMANKELPQQDLFEDESVINKDLGGVVNNEQMESPGSKQRGVVDQLV